MDVSARIVELVWETAETTRPAGDLRTEYPSSFGNRQFRIPYDANGKKWVRFAVWDFGRQRRVHSAGGFGVVAAPVGWSGTSLVANC